MFSRKVSSQGVFRKNYAGVFFFDVESDGMQRVLGAVNLVD